MRRSGGSSWPGGSANGPIPPRRARIVVHRHDRCPEVVDDRLVTRRERADAREVAGFESDTGEAREDGYEVDIAAATPIRNEIINDEFEVQDLVGLLRIRNLGVLGVRIGHRVEREDSPLA